MDNENSYSCTIELTEEDPDGCSMARKYERTSICYGEAEVETRENERMLCMRRRA